MSLTAHFSLEELTRSQTASRHGMDNTPDKLAVVELGRLAEQILEPIRELLGCPLQITSGYRCPELNARIGSTAKHSAHLDGRAADFVPMGCDVRHAFEAIRKSSIPYDQIILECGEWIHIAIAPVYATPRGQAMVAKGGPGAWTYVSAGKEGAA